MQSPSFRPGRASRLALVALLTLTTSCAAFGGDRETWRCNASNGHYQDFSIPIGDKITTITGRLNVHRADLSNEWPSVARIGFTDTSNPDSDCQCNGILLSTHPGDKGVGFYMLVNGEPTLLSGRQFETAITFKIVIDPNNQMTVAVGKSHVDSQTTGLPHPARDSVAMSCSGMDVSFLNIDPQ